MFKTSFLALVLTLSPAFVLAAPAPSISGKAFLPKGALKDMKPTAVLYVIARKEGVQGGPPLAVKRIPQPLSAAVDFTLSASDMMMPGMEFEGKIAITARLAQSGSATPPMQGDYETSKPLIAEVGKTRSVRIILDHFHSQ